jgi:DnaJ homolog subfamily C member 19
MMSLQKATLAASLRCRLNHGGGGGEAVRLLHAVRKELPGGQRAVMSVVSGSHHWHGGNNKGAGSGGGGGAYYKHDRMTNRCSIHTYASSISPGGPGGVWRRDEKDEEEKQQLQKQRLTMMAKSDFHSTATNDKSAVALMLGFGAIAAVSYAGAQGVKAYTEFKASLPDEEPIPEEENKKEEPKQQARAQRKGATEKRENIFKEWFGVSVGAKYYEGGFEDKMTKSEAALILGVRESSPTQRIKEAHKRLVVLNHPDTGGSAYMTGKINEAKELLLKGRMDK